MSLGTQLGPMGNSLQDNNDKMSLGTKFAPMLDTLREIQSEFKTNGATNYSSSTISQTVTPAGTRKISRQADIKNGTGKETTVETSLNAQGQGKQCTEQKTLEDGRIIDTSNSCQRVKTQNQRGQQQSPIVQQQSPPGRDQNQTGQQVDPMGQQVDPPGQQQNLQGQQVDPMGQQQSPMGQQQSPMGQKRKIQAQNQKNQTDNSLNTNDYFNLPQ